MKRVMSSAVQVSVVLLIAASASAKYGGGSGTAAFPYIISANSHLLELADGPGDWSCHFVMAADLGPVTFDRRTIGEYTSSASRSFEGVFDGNGHTIAGFTASGTSVCMGLFGQVGLNGVVRNLTITDGDVTGGTSFYMTGGVVGRNFGQITNCHFAGKVDGLTPSAGTGGIAGRNWDTGRIVGCTADVQVTGSRDSGGIAGYNAGMIANCVASGHVKAEWDFAGGLVGSNSGSLFRCGSSAVSWAVNERSGGLAGGNYGEIRECYATGLVSGSRDVGGLVGYSGGLIQDCYATGRTGYPNAVRVGGLVGCLSRSTIRNCFSSGLIVSGKPESGGFSGLIYLGTLEGCFWDVETSGMATSFGGQGRSTEEMHQWSTYAEGGWDLAGEAANGVEETWLMQDEAAYPRLLWEFTRRPAAHAGPDQTVAAGWNGWAVVLLDGSGSSDPDGDDLTYLWTWDIDGQPYEAEGVHATVELPAGRHLLELVVNDGIVDSPRDGVLICVLGAVQCSAQVVPQTLNHNSQGAKVMAVVQLPEWLRADDIDPEYGVRLEPGGVAADLWRAVGGPKRLTLFAAFDRGQVIAALNEPGSVRVCAVCRLVSGQFLFGEAWINVIVKETPKAGASLLRQAETRDAPAIKATAVR